jgi:cytochrome c peroxidase
MSESGRFVGMRVGAVVGAAIFATSACSSLEDDTDGFSSEEWSLVEQLQPLKTPQPRNPFNLRDNDEDVARFGQMLFFETDVAEAVTADGPAWKKGDVGKIGCLTCHDPNKSFVDSRVGTTSWGRAGAGRRNTPTMVNTGYYDRGGWTGRHDSLMMHGAGVWSTSATPLSYAQYISRKYREEYNAVFGSVKDGLQMVATPLPTIEEMSDTTRFPVTGGPKASATAADGPWEKMSPADQKAIQQIQANLGRAFETYPRMLVTRESPFEVYVRDRNFDAISARAKNGLKLFIGKAACNDCHFGPSLTDNGYHNIGVPSPVGATTPDLGRFPDLAAAATNAFSGVGEFSDNREAGMAKMAAINVMDEKMTGAFKTPGLLNIADTGPYFHTGEAKTLEDVVQHYNRGGGEPGSFPGVLDPRLLPLNLTTEEVGDLVEFLKTLTGTIEARWKQDIAKH